MKVSDIRDRIGIFPKFGVLDTESSNGTNSPMPTASASAPRMLTLTKATNSFFSSPTCFQLVDRNMPYCRSRTRKAWLHPVDKRTNERRDLIMREPQL